MKKSLSQYYPCLIVLITIIFLISYPVIGQNTTSTADEIHYTKDTYTYKVVENCKIQADVYRSRADDIQPAIIWIHGGGLIFGTRNWLSSQQMERYIKAGYTVISIDYRLAPEIRLQDIIEDLEDAYAWVRNKGPALFRIDPDRIVVVGHSAGGYLTLIGGFRLNPRPKALVSFYGYGNITGAWYAQPDSFYNRLPAVSKDQAYAFIGDSVISGTGIQFSPLRRFQFYLYCRQQGLWPREVCGHDPEKERTWYTEYEPIRNVTPLYPPTILLHGEMDTDVPFEQSVLMAEELKHHDVDFEFITNAYWGHVFDNAGLEDPAVCEAVDQILTFLEKHVR